MKFDDSYYLRLAIAAARGSTCLRRKYGAVVVNPLGQVVGIGTNCEPGMSLCKLSGRCEREKLGIPHGERYELCRSVHAEMNAIIDAGRERCAGATLYLAGYENGEPMEDPQPCDLCRRVIESVLIKRVVTK